jgi:hypothetical protein
MTTIPELEKRLEAIESRNQRVSADKAWETSLIRKVCIAALTYLVVASYLIIIHKDQPWINALVPVMGYLLSTLVLAQVKANWVKRIFERRRPQ